MNRLTVQIAIVLLASTAGPSALAGTTPAGTSGPTVSTDTCMQKAFSNNTVTSSNTLTCTANDIRLSKVVDVSQASCVAGTTIAELTATFETVVTANARYDAGFFFRTDGGASARGNANASGSCSLHALDNPPNSVSPGLNLDGDGSGDLNAGTYRSTFKIKNLRCEAAPNTNLLRVPNCTSWHSNAGTQSFPTSPAYFAPDTKAKCNCDDAYTLPVTVEQATFSVTKEVIGPVNAVVPETGGDVTFKVTITNNSQVAELGITSIDDYVNKNDLVAAVAVTALDSGSTCASLIGSRIAAGASANCSFTLNESGAAGTTVTDRVIVNGYTVSTGQALTPQYADATISFSEVFTAPTVSKSVNAAACQVDVTYDVIVSNNSTRHNLTISALNDDKFGSITSTHLAGGGKGQVVSTNCAASTVLPSSSYSCQFVGRVANGTCDVNHTNVVTATAASAAGTPYTPSGSATVTVTDNIQ